MLLSVLLLGGLTFLSAPAPFKVSLGFTTQTRGLKFKPTTPPLGIPDSISHNWGQYSPYFPAAEYIVPDGCVVTQVNWIERHGARFPTTNAGKLLNATIQKFHSLPPNTSFPNPKLDFLKTFVYDLGHDDLVPFGAAQSFDAGQHLLSRYPHLISPHSTSKIPFIRTSSSQRVIDSSTNFTSGLLHAFSLLHHQTLNVAPPLILNEAGNDTLDDNMCPNAGSSDAQDSAWLAVYAPPILARLQTGLGDAASDLNLTNGDVQSLMQLCAFESVAFSNKAKGKKFCDLFSEEEWKLFEYAGDIDKFYNTGYGQPLGPIQGVGYTNELLARLTRSPVSDHTQTNSTLDSDPETFPLDRSIYVDFSHDNQMIAIYASIGLFPQSHPLPLDSVTPEEGRTWKVSKMVPFSAKLVTELLTCEEEAWVRMLVSDVVQPLAFCGGDKRGMCTLDAFVESQGFARSNGGGLFEECF